LLTLTRIPEGPRGTEPYPAPTGTLSRKAYVEMSVAARRRRCCSGCIPHLRRDTRSLPCFAHHWRRRSVPSTTPRSSTSGLPPPESERSLSPKDTTCRLSSARLGYTAAVLEQHRRRLLGVGARSARASAPAALIDEMDCQRILIVCPNTAKRSVWEPELRRLCPWLEVVVLRNSKAQRERDLGYVKQLAASGSAVCAGRPLRGARHRCCSSGKGWARLVFRGTSSSAMRYTGLPILRPRRLVP